MSRGIGLNRLAQDLGAGRVSATQLVEDCIARIVDPEGEGARTFVKTHAAAARATAAHVDRLRKLGVALPRFAGIPLSVKDLFDVAGEPTPAGSVALADAPPAAHDAPAVARVKAEGFISVGRTNMTEFAFSGVGINPHFGTPANPWDRATRRIPGGSSSGAAISVTDGMAAAALGTDTGGSCRIPAALTGLVGWKPTARRVPLAGVLPLAPSLDSVGSLAWHVEDCAIIDSVMAGEPVTAIPDRPLTGLRLAVPQTLVLDELDAPVAAAFERALTRLSAAGCLIGEVPLPELHEVAVMSAKGGFPAAEAYAWHRALLAAKGELYDPRVKPRIERGRNQDAADYIALCAARADWIARMVAILAPYDALLMPTTPIVAPAIDDFATEDAFRRLNGLLLRNTTLINFLDGCAVSVPCHAPGGAPVGLMLAGCAGTDATILAIGRAVDDHLASV